MGQPYLHPGPKRLAAALLMAGFDGTVNLPARGENPKSYGTEVRTMIGIAYGETAGNAVRVNHNKKDGVITSTDFGMWQINDLYEGDVLIRTLPKYAKFTGKELRATFGKDPRNTFHEYLRQSNRSWQSYTDNALMARAVYVGSKRGFYPWVAFWNAFQDFSGIDVPSRVNWASIDQGLADLKAEQVKGYPLDRIASIYLEGLTAAPRAAITR